jgi:hypothetical protein
MADELDGDQWQAHVNACYDNGDHESLIELVDQWVTNEPDHNFYVVYALKCLLASRDMFAMDAHIDNVVSIASKAREIIEARGDHVTGEKMEEMVISYALKFRSDVLARRARLDDWTEKKRG